MLQWSHVAAFEFWARVSIALLCGAIVGLERELMGKPAGLRTCMLVCLGTAAFVRLGIDLEGERGDPTRVLSQIVAGVGFLGAGAILTRGGHVEGVTTAATIWILAAIGAAAGAGHAGTAFALSLLTTLALVGLRPVERYLAALRGPPPKQ
jgi:putative Mg2+ transporter-C (MgtC) family protein